MGKGKKNSKAKKLSAKKNESSTTAASPAKLLLEQGNIALSRVEPELALQFFERAYQIDSNDTDVMDALSDVLVRLNEPEKALSFLMKSTQIAPTENPGKWLCMAQLLEGQEALNSYNRGIELLKSTGSGDSNEQASVAKQLAKAYSGVAELYLTDLCYDEDAETQCERAVSDALACDASSIDALHAQASLRLSQSRTSEACDIIQQVYDIISRRRDAVIHRTVVEELQGDSDSGNLSTEENEFPSAELCVTTAKMLLECSCVRPEMAQKALDMIVSLLHDDDENIELWYLAGVAEMTICSQQTTPDYEAANYYLSQAKIMIEELRQQYQQQNSIQEIDSCSVLPFEDELSLVLSHLKIIEQSSQSGAQATIPMGNQNDDDEEWSSDEDNMDCESSAMDC